MLLLFDPAFSLLDVELVLEAGDERFWETVEEDVACFPGGDVFTERGEVSPELFDVIVTLLLEFEVWLLVKGGVLLVGAPVVLKSCGEATPVEEVESAYLQLAEGFSIPGLCAPGLAWCKWAALPPPSLGWGWSWV